MKWTLYLCFSYASVPEMTWKEYVFNKVKLFVWPSQIHWCPWVRNPDPDPGRQKWPTKIEKSKKIIFLKCWTFSFEGWILWPWSHTTRSASVLIRLSGSGIPCTIMFLLIASLALISLAMFSSILFSESSCFLSTFPTAFFTSSIFSSAICPSICPPSCPLPKSACSFCCKNWGRTWGSSRLAPSPSFAIPDFCRRHHRHSSTILVTTEGADGTQDCWTVHSLPHPRHGALSLSLSFLGGIPGRLLTGSLAVCCRRWCRTCPPQQRLRQYFVHVARTSTKFCLIT